MKVRKAKHARRRSVPAGPAHHWLSAVATVGVAVGLVLVISSHTDIPAGPPPAVGAASRTPVPAGVATVLSATKLLSYCPATACWTNLWTNWSPSTIAPDLAKISALGATAVRVVVDPWTFGYPTPSATMTARFAQMVQMASANHLKVFLTLFDWWGSYSDVSGSEQWAKSFLSPYVGDPRISLIEVKNEIDPTDPAAMAWARQLVPYVRTVSGGTPVTVSISSTAGTAGLAAFQAALGTSQPDFYDFHYYGPAAYAYATLALAAAEVAPHPLYIGETGYSTSAEGSDGVVLTGPTSTPALEVEQDLYLRTIELATQQLRLPPAGVWTLNDLTAGAAPPAADLTPQDYGFGLYRTDGSAKPVAASIRQFFTSGTVNQSFNNGFESTTMGLPVLWQLFDASQETVAADSTVSHSGSTSVRISATTGSSQGFPGLFVTPPNAAIHPGSTYGATVWARGSQVTGVSELALAWFGANGAYLGEVDSKSLPTGSTGWVQLAASGKAPTGAETVEIFLKSAFNSGSVWFDDVTYSPA